MTRKMIPAMALILFASACSHHQDLTQPQTQDNFGVQMARMNLWREALFRFQRAVQINPSDAMAHNNLAVAWEANGDFEKARKEYLEALKLDRSNQYIQKNYSRYVEFLSRNRKRQQKEVKTAAATPAVPAAAAPPTIVDSPLPGQPVAVEPVKPAPPTAAPPSDLPPQPKPPGGAR
jgi:Flp pilus assembly protein TadD